MLCCGRPHTLTEIDATPSFGSYYDDEPLAPQDGEDDYESFLGGSTAPTVSEKREMKVNLLSEDKNAPSTDSLISISILTAQMFPPKHLVPTRLRVLVELE